LAFPDGPVDDERKVMYRLTFIVFRVIDTITQIEEESIMRMETHTTDRKLLAKAIGEWLDSDVRYDGMPHCTYSIGPVKVDREGVITTDDQEACDTLQPFFQNHGLTTEESNMISIKETLAQTPEIDTMEISVPAPDLTVIALHNLIRMLYSKQYLFNRMTETGSLFIAKTLIDALQDQTPVDMSAFESLLAESADRGELDGFRYADGKITLRYPFDEKRPMRWTSYGLLTDGIVRLAQASTRVKAEIQQPENEKYYARAWLMRMGMGGDDFKEARKILLGGLNGHAAFPDAAAAMRHKERHATRRRDAHDVLSPNTES